MIIRGHIYLETCKSQSVIPDIMDTPLSQSSSQADVIYITNTRTEEVRRYKRQNGRKRVHKIKYLPTVYDLHSYPLASGVLILSCRND